ncbi:uncharacterized protein LOC143588128 [Bidens hawaiensis]|uniref:uncharacterized protein LOC143588128 n=1 Tax=Bidens hawaiensis TaxID=980011 RepID=UPI00404AE9B9
MMHQQEQLLKKSNEDVSSGSYFGAFGNQDLNKNSQSIRVGKVEFPKFNSEDVEGWVYRCEHFFAVNETPENIRLKNAVIHLEGDAIQWHTAFMKIRESSGIRTNISWRDYVLAITTRFSNAMFEDTMEELASLNQGDDLQVYNSAFDRLLNKVTISESQAISLYVKGLKPEIKGPIKMFKPRTLHEAYGLARIQNINNMNLMNTITGKGVPLKTS